MDTAVMGLLLFLMLLAVPLAELWVIVEVAQRIGVPFTLVLLFGISLVGAWLLKREGMAAWRRLVATVRKGEVPANELTDAGLILLGGALLLTPGFLTDVVGLLLLVAPSRAVVKRVARKILTRLALRRFGAAGRSGRWIYETTATRGGRAGRSSIATPPREGAGTPPIPEHRSGEGDSPHTG